MRIAVVAFVLSLCACGPANQNDPEFWEPSLTTAATDDDGGTPSDDAGTVTPTDDAGTVTPTDDSGTATPSGNCLHVEFTTSSDGGRYSPSHVEAVWITDASGKFVRTLALYGFRRTSNLTKYRSAGASTVDAITGATLTKWGALKYDWNCLDSKKAHVPPGNYLLKVEMADQDSGFAYTPPSLQVPFTIGMPGTSTPAAVKSFSNITMTVNY